MDALGLAIGALALLVAVVLVVALLVVPIVLLVWFLRSGSTPGDRRAAPAFTDDEEIAARRHR